MAPLTSSEQIHDVFTGFTQDRQTALARGRKLLASNTILLDGTHDPTYLTQGDSEVTPDVKFTMSVHNAHLLGSAR